MEPKLTLEQAKKEYRCRICGESISNEGCPKGWQEEFGKMVYPIAVTLNFGEEFAHTKCLGEEPIRSYSQ